MSDDTDSAPVWSPGDGSNVVSGWEMDCSATPEPAPGKRRLLTAGMDTTGTVGSPTNALLSNKPWLNPTGETNGSISFTLHDSQAEETYGARNQTGLIIPEWKIEPEVRVATNRDGTSYSIPVFGPVDLVALWRQDSIGNLGLFFSAATTNSESGTVYSARIGVRCGDSSFGGSPFVIQGRISF